MGIEIAFPKVIATRNPAHINLVDVRSSDPGIMAECVLRFHVERAMRDVVTKTVITAEVVDDSS